MRRVTCKMLQEAIASLDKEIEMKNNLISRWQLRTEAAENAGKQMLVTIGAMKLALSLAGEAVKAAAGGITA